MSDSPILTQWIRLGEDNDQPFDAYLALPPAGHGPGLLLLQEIFGVNPHIRALAEQYALAGYVVLAPDLFWRQATRIELGYEGGERDRAIAMMKAAAPAELGADVTASMAALRSRPEVAGRRAGAIGYCMGGRLAWAAAAAGQVDAAVAYYGGGIQDQLQLAPAIACPIQLHYGDRDAAIPLEAVERVRAALQPQLDTGRAELHVYDDAGHGFNCWARPAYQPAASALALGRSLTFLAQRLFCP
jgi:carboxymethylenebutenolidase